jgi:hypothetical protein
MKEPGHQTVAKLPRSAVAAKLRRFRTGVHNRSLRGRRSACHASHELSKPREALIRVDVEPARQARHRCSLDERLGNDGTLEFGAVLPVVSAFLRWSDWLNFLCP